MNITFDEKIFNPLYWHIKDAMSKPEIRLILFYGGSSSGKSHSASQAIINDALETEDSTIIMRKYAVDIRDSIYSDVKGIGQKIDVFTHNFEFIQNIIRIGKAHLRFRGLDHEERIKGITNYKRVYMDELTDFTLADFNQIKKRLRGRKGQQILASWNPISRQHWIKKSVIDLEEWIDLPKDIPDRKYSMLSENSFKKVNKKGNILLIKSTYLDNFWIVGHPAGEKYGFKDQHVIDNFEHDKIHNTGDYNVYALGEWGVISTRQIFRNWAEIDEIPATAKRIPSGLDFGFNPDPVAFANLYVEGNNLYIDELIYKRNLVNIISDNPLQESIQAELEGQNYDKEHLIICESAEPKSIRELRTAGFNCYAVKKPSVLESLKQLLWYKIYITKRSTNAIFEFDNYVRAINKDGEKLPEPIDKDNHIIDLVRYVISQRGRLWDV